MSNISHAYPITIEMKRSPNDEQDGPSPVAMVEFLEDIQRSFRDSLGDCMKKGTLPIKIEFIGRFIVQGKSIGDLKRTGQ